MQAAPRTIDSLIEDFGFLDDWEDRYRYVIELGRSLPPLADDERSEANKVRGCASQVWLVNDPLQDAEATPAGGPALGFRGDSDAHIVRGLIAILLALYSGRTAREIVAIDAEAALGRLGLREHLTAQRSNGLSSMVNRIRADAEAALAPSFN
ncbi:MAG: SufE family protein [Rhizobiales bacterium]|nr:SufE family protein [Hyphomicrobiales bacterium]MDQ3558066.1 SufE family protein [Pseudomonadota bacterium]